VATVAQLRKLGLATGIYPLLDVIVERADQPFVKAALQDTDRRVGEGKPVAPSFLLACVLWADVRDGWAQRSEGRHGQRPQASFPALQDAIDDVFNARIGDVSGRGKLAADMREIWMMQPRFDKRSGATPYSLVEQARFRAAFDFMRLRADVGEVSEAIAEWWQEFSTSDDVRRQDLLEQVRDEQKTRQRVRTRDPVASKPRSEPVVRQRQDTQEPAQQDDELETETAGASSDGEAAAPRKRRRRRKPRTGGAAGSGGAGEGGGSAAGE
jgi:poly(A) polymerase